MRPPPLLNAQPAPLATDATEGTYILSVAIEHPCWHLRRELD